ncbi:MAG: Ig-like domain repeat protein [Nitrospirae bacterium]|nr:Ig-like domain repeat protein [Nitrospirota bacterium]
MKKGSFVSASLACLLILLPLATANAATLTVTNLNDSGAGSLRQAIADASSGDTINFNVNGTITLSSRLSIDKNLTITGPGATSLTISGNNTVQVLYVSPGITLNLNNLTVANGNAGTSEGGGLNNNVGTVIINSCTFANNTAFNGGGLLNNVGSVTISNSTFSGNSASLPGFGTYGGGIQGYGGTVTISNSTFSGNSASNGGGGLGVSDGTLSIISSTFSNNAVTNGNGGGFFYFSGNFDITFTISNSTFSGNSASGIGGGICSDGMFGSRAVSITNSTFSGNSASTGGGLFNGVGGPMTIMRSTSNIINNNTGGNCWGGITNGGYNIDSGATCGFGSNNGSMSSTDPLLSSLGDNGGPTQTHELLSGSPAIDVIPLGTNGCGFTINTDQRGITRPVNNSCDIGSFEVGIATAVTALTSSVNPSVFGQAVDFTATVGGASPTGTVTFSDNGVDIPACINLPLVSGSAACASSGLSSGNHTITATYSGDSNNAASNDTLMQEVSQADTTTTITGHTPSPSGVGQPVTVGFTVTPDAPGSGSPTGNVIVISGDGAANCIASATAGNCALAFSTTGAKTLYAYYLGDAEFNGSMSAGIAHGVRSISYNLSINRSGTGSGRVISSPTGIDCGTSCSASYDAGAMVTLMAEPDNGYTFIGWSGGGCSGTRFCTVTMNANVTVTAVFSCILPLPLEQEVFTYEAIAKSGGACSASGYRPLGVGDAAMGLYLLDLEVGLPQFTGPVDAYLAFYAPELDPLNIYILKPDNTMQTMAAGIVTWREGVGTFFVERPLGMYYTSSSGMEIPDGDFHFGLLVTPAGEGLEGPYYFWVTFFGLP